MKKKIDIINDKITFFKEEIKMARMNGDLSENVDWQLLEEKLQKKYLEREILEREILERENKKEMDVIYKIKGELKKIKISNFSNPLEGIISYNSPLGKLLYEGNTGKIEKVKIEEGKDFEIEIISKKIC